MIGVDTNILLRYLLKDAGAQTKAARRLIDEECSPQDPAYLSDVVIAETALVLAKRLRKSKSEIVQVLFDIIYVQQTSPRC